MSGRTRAGGFAWLIVGVCAVPASAADAALDAKQACIAAVEQGQTQRDDGKYRQARASFLACAQDACPHVIQQSCTKWLRELDDGAPTIVLGAKDEQGNDLPNVNVTFDGAPFVTQLDGKPVEVDAGEHVIRFDREGRTPVQQNVLLRAGEKARLIRVILQPLGAGGDANGAVEATLSAHHVVAASIAAGALAAAGTGIYFIVQSNQDKSTADNLRNGALAGSGACANPAASVASGCQALSRAVHSQHDETNVATGLFVGAGVLAAGAVAAWFLWPKPHPDETQTTGAIVPVPGGASLSVSGSFQ